MHGYRHRVSTSAGSAQPRIDARELGERLARTGVGAPLPEGQRREAASQQTREPGHDYTHGSVASDRTSCAPCFPRPASIQGGGARAPPRAASSALTDDASRRASTPSLSTRATASVGAGSADEGAGVTGVSDCACDGRGADAHVDCRAAGPDSLVLAELPQEDAVDLLSKVSINCSSPRDASDTVPRAPDWLTCQPPPQAYSPVWSARTAACCGLSAILQSERRAEVAPIADKVVAMLLERTTDPHYRLAKQCDLRTPATTHSCRLLVPNPCKPPPAFSMPALVHSLRAQGCPRGSFLPGRCRLHLPAFR